MNLKSESIEQFTPEIQDILGSPPKRIIRYGMSFFGIICMLLIGLSWWVQYPDTLVIPCTLTANSPAVSLNMPVDGRINYFLVYDKQNVKAGQAIAVIEDAADYKSVEIFRKLLTTKSKLDFLPSADKLKLGALKPTYIALQKAASEYHFFLNLHFHERKINVLRNKLASSRLLRGNLDIQAKLNEKDAKLGQRVYELDSLLFKRKGLTSYEYTTSERTFIREQSSYWQSKSATVNADIQLNEISQSIVDLELEKKQKERELKLTLEHAHEQAYQSIIEWERKNIISSPINGLITFNIVRSANQRSKASEVIATVLPSQHSKIYCKAKMPVAGSGKVSIGQRVQIKFDNYPSSEFGAVQGIVQTISLSPSEDGFLVRIDLPKGLKTTYGVNLPYKHNISGSAEIITSNRRLLERLFANFSNLIR